MKPTQAQVDTAEDLVRLSRRAFVTATQLRDAIAEALVAEAAQERAVAAAVIEAARKPQPQSAWESAWNDACAWLATRLRTQAP